VKRKHKRLVFVAIGLMFLGLATGLVLYASRSFVSLFMSPSDIVRENPPPERRLRIGGLVEQGSVQKAGGGLVHFRVTDLANTVPVTYKGILPDLFREGQGIVAEGRYVGGAFEASEVLAKHDENYMPPDVADALKKAGQWKETKPRSP